MLQYTIELKAQWYIDILKYRDIWFFLTPLAETWPNLVREAPWIGEDNGVKKEGGSFGVVGTTHIFKITNLRQLFINS